MLRFVSAVRSSRPSTVSCHAHVETCDRCGGSNLELSAETIRLTRLKASLGPWRVMMLSSYTVASIAWIKNMLSRLIRIYPSVSSIYMTSFYIIMCFQNRMAKCKGYQCRRQNSKKHNTPVCSRNLQRQNCQPREADQHLAFTVHPASLTLAANTSTAPSKADVEAQACGATYLPPSAACSAPPIGLYQNRQSATVVSLTK